jgi:hypothetical protein
LIKLPHSARHLPLSGFPHPLPSPFFKNIAHQPNNNQQNSF